MIHVTILSSEVLWMLLFPRTFTCILFLCILHAFLFTRYSKHSVRTVTTAVSTAVPMTISGEYEVVSPRWKVMYMVCQKCLRSRVWKRCSDAYGISTPKTRGSTIHSLQALVVDMKEDEDYVYTNHTEVS